MGPAHCLHLVLHLSERKLTVLRFPTGCRWRCTPPPLSIPAPHLLLPPPSPSSTLTFHPNYPSPCSPPRPAPVASAPCCLLYSVLVSPTLRLVWTSPGASMFKASLLTVSPVDAVCQFISPRFLFKVPSTVTSSGVLSNLTCYLLQTSHDPAYSHNQRT